MQLIFDNLVALLIGTVVLVILVALTTGWATENRDRTRAYMTREMQRSLADMFERDVLNVGANVPVGDPMLVENSDSLFSFYGAVNGSGVARLIEYRLVSQTQPDSAVVYKVERWVDGAYSGGSAALLNSFEVDLLDETDVHVTTAPYSDARKIVIRFESALPYAVDSDKTSLRQLNWESVYQPTLLAR